MNGYKELWIEAHEAFIEVHGREPSAEEMHNIMADILGSRADAAMERMRD